MVVLLIITPIAAASGFVSAYEEQPGDTAHEIIDIMISCGFENVTAFTLSDTLIVEYENRIYFRERDAIRIIIAKTMDAAREIQTLILVPKRDNVPLLRITVSRDDYLDCTKNDDIIDKLETSQEATITDYDGANNSSVGKIDIILYPTFDSSLGRFSDPFMYRLAISPEFCIRLGKGIRGSAQVHFVLHDEIEAKYRRKRVGFSRLCLDYTYRTSASAFMNLGGGYFGDNRYGLASEVLFLGWGNRIGIGGTAAWLSNIYYWDNTLHYTKLWKWTALANLQYRLPYLNLLLTTRLGTFLYQDRGVSVEVTRFFRNTGLTVFAAKTSDGSIGGFEVQFLTYPRRHPVPHRVRVRLPTMLNVQYRYKENGVGTMFSPGYDIDYTTDSFWLMDIE